MLSPLGDFPHAKGLQRIDDQALSALVTEFNSLPARLGRLFVGIPFYIGHPDVPGLENEYTDKKAYGWVTELSEAADGLYAKVKWSKAGAEMIAEGYYRFLSPFWNAVQIGTEGNRPIYRPNKLLSVGLTNNPNLPVLPFENSTKGTAPTEIACIGSRMPISDDRLQRDSRMPISDCRLGNQDEGADENDFTVVKNRKQASQQDHMKTEKSSSVQTPTNKTQNTNDNGITIENVLSLLDLPGTATLEDVKARLQSAGTRQKSEVSVPNSGVPRSEWLEMQSRMERLEQRLITTVLDNAIQAGRVVPAQRTYWAAQLAEDFETKSAELANAGKVLKTDRRVEEFMLESQRQDESAARRKQIQRLMASKTAKGLSYDQAWEELKEEHPALFSSMQQPA